MTFILHRFSNFSTYLLRNNLKFRVKRIYLNTKRYRTRSVWQPPQGNITFNVDSALRMHIRQFHDDIIKQHPEISLSQIKNSLASKKIEFVEGFTNVIIKCPICINIKKNDMYINKVTGFVTCPSCKRFGQWNDLEEIIIKGKKDTSDHTLKKYNSEMANRWKEICKTLRPLSSLESHKKRKIFKEINLTEIQDDVIEQLNLYVDDNLTFLYVPLTYASGSDVVGYKKIQLQKLNDTKNCNNDLENLINPFEGSMTEPSHNCRGIIIYKLKNVKKDKAVLVHSFKDFISLVNFNLNYNIICLPHGLTSLPQDVLPILEKYKKLILWFGNEIGCWDSSKQFAKKLNYKRCFFIRPVEENPPPHIVALRDDATEIVKYIIKKAEPIHHPSIIEFSSIRQDVLSELHNINKVRGVQWHRYPGLNALLKGFRRGELTILTGPTGSGKTTFLSEYSLDLLTQGVATLWGSFEIRNQRLARVMLQQYAQIPLETNLENINFWADCFERLPVHFMTFHGQQPLKVVLQAAQHATYVHDIAHLIIDNVQFMLGMLDNETSLDRFYRQDALIGAMRNFASTYNCHVTLVIHPRKERDGEQLTISSVFGGAKASQEADNVLIIQQRVLQSLKIKKFLQIAKNRFSGDLGLIPLEFDKDTLCFCTKFEKKLQTKFNDKEIDSNILKDAQNIEDLHVLQ